MDSVTRVAGGPPPHTVSFHFLDGYLDRAHVVVYSEDPVTKALTPIPPETYTWLNDYQIQGVGLDVPIVVVRRETPAGALTDFINGSHLTANNLNVAARQGLLRTVELHEQPDRAGDIAGLLVAGTNIVRTGAGTSADPYVISTPGYSAGAGIKQHGTTFSVDFGLGPSQALPGSTPIPQTAADLNAVPTTRTVGGKPLSSDVSLDASDVGALEDITGLIKQGSNVTITGAGTPGDPYEISAAGGGGGGAVTSVNSKTGAVTLNAADVGAVPTAREVNGKPLSSNVSLSAADVGALPDDAELGDLDNVSASGGSTGDVLTLQGNGSWAPQAPQGGGGAVTSVNAKTGAVTLDATDVGALADDAKLGDLDDVAVSGGNAGDVLTLQGNGSWQPQAPQGGGGGGGGTVTSVGLSVPTGLSVSGSPITSSGSISVSYASGYSIPKTADTAKGVTAHGWGDHGQAGYVKDSDIVTTVTGVSDTKVPSEKAVKTYVDNHAGGGRASEVLISAKTLSNNTDYYVDDSTQFAATLPSSPSGYIEFSPHNGRWSGDFSINVPLSTAVYYPDGTSDTGPIEFDDPNLGVVRLSAAGGDWVLTVMGTWGMAGDPPGDHLVIVEHGSTAGTARPHVGMPPVYWVGSVAPTNAEAKDLWGGP